MPVEQAAFDLLVAEVAATRSTAEAKFTEHEAKIDGKVIDLDNNMEIITEKSQSTRQK